MSDTDDTDILLLIPPNFFYEPNSGDSDDSLLQSSRTVVHKPKSCTSHVIVKLVNQVHTLESRLDSLESNTTTDLSTREAFYGNKTCDFSISFDSLNLDKKSFTFPRERKRNITPKRKRRQLSITSIESSNTCEQAVSPLNLKSNLASLNDIQSMDGDISSIISTPSKKNDRLFLHEIDEFLHKVESYENTDIQYKASESTLSPQQIIKATGEYFTQKLNSNDVTTDVKTCDKQDQFIFDKYIYLTENSSKVDNTRKIQDGDCDLIDKTPKSSNNLPVQDGRSPAFRKLQYSEVNKNVQPTSTPKKITTYKTSDTKSVSTQSSSFRPTSNKVYDRASRILDQYKGNNLSKGHNDDNSINTSLLMKDETKQQSRFNAGDFKMPREVYKGSHKFIDSIDSELLSLSDLWGSKGDKVESIKLEEERLKREHCEAMIQELQKKLLDQQERLAVAMKVDRAKDAAISKLKDAWRQITAAFDRNQSKHNEAINKMAMKMQEYQKVTCDFQKKAEHFEAELYKALDLAHDYQEKCKVLNKEKQETEDKTSLLLKEKDGIIQQRETEISDLRDSYETVLRLNKQTGECIKNLENALEKEQSEHNATRSKILDINKKTETITTETTLLIQERDILKDKINEERAKCSVLEKQLADKINTIKEIKKREEVLASEVSELHGQLERQREELRVQYQSELEAGVVCKLQQFQDQLEHARDQLEAEARAREKAAQLHAHTVITHAQQQHKMEISVLEEKHKEEIKLYRLQIAQANEKAQLLESKVESYRRRRGQLASQLHGVMETQWRHALSILTAPATPTADHTLASTPACQDYEMTKVSPLTMPASEPFFKHTEHSPDKMINFDSLSDTELQHYVKTLLNKPPASSPHPAPAPAPTEVSQEGRGARGDGGDPPTSDRGGARGRGHKPPWKS